MKKYLAITMMLLACSLLFVACNKQEEEDDNQVHDIQFGEKTDMGEEEDMESIFEFLGDIRLPDITLDNPEEIHYVFKKKHIQENDPTYSLGLIYDKEVSEDVNNLVDVEISNHEEALDSNYKENLLRETIMDGKEVSIWEPHENVISVTFEDNGLHYYLRFQLGNFGAVSEDDAELVKIIDKETELHDEMHKQLTQSFEEKFILPSYFTTDLDLYEAYISRGGLGFHYTKDYDPDNNKEKVPHLTYSISSGDLSWIERDDVEHYEDIVLPSGREAFMTQDDRAEGFPHNGANKIYTTDDERVFHLRAYNIKEVEQKEEAQNLIKVMDSIDEK